MAWPEPLVLLLARTDSQASQALRWGLRGLRASLQAVLLELPQDPGCEQLRALLAELEPLLDPAEEMETVPLRRHGQSPFPPQGSLSASLVLPSDAAGDRSPEGAAGTDRSRSRATSATAQVPRLLPLARAVAGDGRFRAELERSPIPDGSDDQIWNGVQRLLLRVPQHLAEEWRHRSQEFAHQAGGRLDEWAALALPLPWDEAIYPGVTGEIRAAGLRSAPTAALDPRLAAPAGDDLRVLATITSTCLWFVDHDPHLYHCLKSVFRFGMVPLTGEQRERYIAELLRLWERVRTASSPTLPVGMGLAPTRSASEEATGEQANAEEKGTVPLSMEGKSSFPPLRQPLKEHLKTLLDLDEALHSLVYQPAAAPDSWWARLLGQAREALFRARDRAVQAGGAVHFQLLGGNFADINRLAPDSLQVDFGVPGEVSACLRIWARIEGEELKGRVLYRSPEEES